MIGHAETLIDQLGGPERVAAVVEAFYRRVLADDGLNYLFGSLDMERQRRHQAAFLAHALGVADAYHGRSLRRAHHGLGINIAQFDAAVRHLQAALESCAVPAPTAFAITAAVAALQAEVVGV